MDQKYHSQVVSVLKELKNENGETIDQMDIIHSLGIDS